MERNSSVDPQTPLQKALQIFVFDNAAQQNPTIIITPDTVEGDSGYLPETSLKLIQEWIGKHTIEAALKQYKTQVSSLVSTKAPFTEKDLKNFHEQVLQTILISFDSTYKDVLSSNPSLTQVLQHERGKLESAIKTQSRTFLASYENTIGTITRYLKDCTLEAENAYMEDMERFLESAKSIGAIKLLHEDCKKKALQNFSDILREKASLEFKTWMTHELESKLEDKLEQTQEEFCNSEIASTDSKAKSIPADYILEEIGRNDKIKELIQNSAEKHASDKIKEFIQGNQFDKLIEDNYSKILQDKLGQLVEDKLSNIVQEELGNLVKDKLSKAAQGVDKLVETNFSSIVNEKLDKLVEDKVSNIVQEKLDKLVENKVSKLVNEKTAIIVDQHLKLLKQFEGLNTRFNAIQKENLGFKAKAESVDNTLRTVQNDLADVQTKMGSLKDDRETKSQILKNRLDDIQKERNSSSDYIKFASNDIKNIKDDYIDVVMKLEKLENNMNTFKETENNQKTVITKLIQKLQSAEATVQKLQLQSPSLEHHQKNQESGTKFPSTQKTIPEAKSTNLKSGSHKPKPEVPRTPSASTVSNSLNGGLAKSDHPVHHTVAGNVNGQQTRQGVNSGVPNFQQQGQVTTGKVPRNERQTPVSRGHSTTNLVLENKSSPFMLTLKERKASLFEKSSTPKSPEKESAQPAKLPTTSTRNLSRSISAYSVNNFK
ncbi:unnamed protein product [Allacma fusca]|uniref:Uncharacterized protein n=1 Tax=Allacma fusca TaxID=39272 RepID=A0A8J2PFW2_9HEXA|nr:unnamed protein product [Allacma fusca]